MTAKTPTSILGVILGAVFTAQIMYAQHPTPPTKVAASETAFRATWSISGGALRIPQEFLGVRGFVSQAGQWSLKVYHVDLTPIKNSSVWIEGATAVGLVLPPPYLLSPETKSQSPFQMKFHELNLPWWNSADRARVDLEHHPTAPSVESFPGRPNLMDPNAPLFPRPIW